MSQLTLRALPERAGARAGARRQAGARHPVRNAGSGPIRVATRSSPHHAAGANAGGRAGPRAPVTKPASLLR